MLEKALALTARAPVAVEPDADSLALAKKLIADSKPSLGEYAVEGLKNLGRGAVRGVAQVLDMPSTLATGLGFPTPAGASPYQDKLGPMQGDPALNGPALSGVGPFISAAGGAVGSSLPALAGGGLGAAARISATATTMAIGASQAGAAKYHEAKMTGASDDDAWQAATWSALVGMSEGVPLAKIAGKFSRAETDMIAGVLQRANKGTKGKVVEILTNGAEEFGQEAAQSLADDIINKYALGSEEKISVMRALEGGILGFVVGGGLTAGAMGATGEFGADKPPEMPVLEQPAGSLLAKPSAELPGTTESAAQEQVAPVARGAQELRVVREDVARGEPVAPIPEAELVAEPAKESAETSSPEPAPQEPAGSTPESDAPKAKETPEVEPEPRGKATGIKNRIVDAELAELGFDPVEKSTGVTFKGEHAKARAAFEEDQHVGSKLVAELAKNPRAPSTVEDMLISMERLRLDLEREAAEDAYNKSPTEAGQARIDAAREAYQQASEVADRVGAESSRSLSFRRHELARDFSLAAIERRMVVANKGEPLTKEETEWASKQAKDFRETQAKAQAAIDARLAKAEADIAELETKTLKVEVRGRDKRAARIAKTDAEIKAAVDEFVEFTKGKSFAGLDPEVVGRVAKIAGLYVKKGVQSFEAFAAHMVEVAGEKIRPYLETAWSDAGGKSRKSPQERALEARIAKLEKKIAEGDLTKDGPKQGPDTARVAELKGQRDVLQAEITKLREGQPGARPVQDVVRLEREVKELESRIAKGDTAPRGKRQGPDTEDVAALKAQRAKLTERMAEMRKGPHARADERALQRQITDLENRIRTGESPARGPKQGPDTAAVVDLKSQRDALRQQLRDAIDSKKGPIVPADVRALRRQIAEMDEKLRTGDLSSRPKKQGPDTAEVADLKSQRAKLTEQLRAARAKPRGRAEVRHLERSIARLESRIARGDTSTRGKKQGPDTEETTRLKAIRDTLNARLAELRRKPANPFQVVKTRKERQLARLREQLATKNYGTKRKQGPPPINDEIAQLMVDVEKVKREIEKGVRKKEYEHRTKQQVAIDSAKAVLALPRSVMTSFDLSAVLRQGAFFAFGHPVRTIRQARIMLRSLKGDDYAEVQDTKLRGRPGAKFADASGLELTSLDAEIGPQEEAIRSQLASKIPGLRKGIDASNRAFITMLNQQRAEMFDEMVRSLPGTPTVEQGKALAFLVNAATGRGNIKSVAKHMETAGLFIWSPRLLISRAQLLVGGGLHKGDRHTRKIIIKQYARALSGLAVVYALGVMAGGEIEDDPRSTDFGKVKLGPTRVDPLAGLSQMTVLLSREISGKRKDFKGNIVPIRGENVPYGADTATDLVVRFLRNKMTPLIGAAADILNQEDFKGDPITPGSIAQNLLIPMSFGDIAEAMQEHGATKGTALAMLSILGMGLNTYQDKDSTR